MRALGLALAVAIALPVMGDVRVLVRPNGTKMISNFGSPLRNTNLAWLARQRDRRSPYDNIIDRYADHYGVDPVLVRAVIQVESDFNPRCLSKKGAQGLMQLIPGTAKRYGVKNAFSPEENIRGGVHYLADLLQMFNNDLHRALAAYNAGENAVIRYAGIPPYAETTMYVTRAMTVYHGYPYNQATSFSGDRNGRKLKGGFGTGVLQPVLAAIPGMRILGTTK